MDFEHEEWRVAPGLSEYEVSSFGRVRRTDGDRIRRPRIDGDGYRTLSVANGRGSAETIKIARLVCHAFHGPAPAEQPEVDHRDRDRSMDHKDNLHWCTRQQNMENADYAVGEGNGRARLTDDLVREIRSSTERTGLLAARLGVAHRTVSAVRSGHSWRHVK